MNSLPAIGKVAKGGRDKSNWQVRGMMRLAQFKKPGLYPMALLVNADGTRQLVAENGKIEDLGS